MKKYNLLFYALLLVFISVAQEPIKYQTIQGLTILGRPFPNQTTYQRFPDSLESLLRKPVWQLSKNSTGLAIYFESNSKQISAKWKTGASVNFSHVAATLVKGVDLYAMDNHQWYYVGVGKPNNSIYQEASIIKGLDGGVKQFLMYLPDYETTDSLLLGIDSTARIQNVTNSVFTNKKPLVFYGTSILQGASAMRSGMAYPAIIERGLQRETINLGFSGNGQLDSMLAVIMSHIDAACYVIDCGPNLTSAMAAERTLPFLKILRQNKPTTPILLVAQIEYPTARFVSSLAQKIKLTNQHFNKAFTTLKNEGDKNIYYLPSKGLIGNDGEGTVDGVHLTDLGFYRMANAIKKKLQTILK
jgi:lysophospholipase L1-like esterase